MLMERKAHKDGKSSQVNPQTQCTSSQNSDKVFHGARHVVMKLIQKKESAKNKEDNFKTIRTYLSAVGIKTPRCRHV